MTLSGVMDFAAGSIKDGVAASQSTVSTRDLTSATSVIRITAVEDLGGGMKAMALYALDPRHFANDSAGGAPATPGMQRDEAYIGLMGGFGSIKLGAANSIGLTTFLAGSPLGTGIGSGYAATALDYSFIRHSRAARYDSPAMNGFAVAINYAPGADVPVGAAEPYAIPLNSEVTELGLSYNNGPLSLNYANVTQAAQPTKARTSANILAARYTIGSTVLSAGWNDGDATKRTADTPATQTEGYRVGVAHNMGAVTLLGSYAVQKAGVTEEKVTGLRADYALSKRTAAYVGYENYDKGNNTDRKTTSIGVRHAF